MQAQRGSRPRCRRRASFTGDFGAGAASFLTAVVGAVAVGATLLFQEQQAQRFSPKWRQFFGEIISRKETILLSSPDSSAETVSAPVRLRIFGMRRAVLPFGAHASACPMIM